MVIARKSSLDFAPLGRHPLGEFMSCTCHGCKKKYTVDLIIPDSLWEQIYIENPSKAKDGGGLLCPTCIAKRIEDLGEYLSLEITQR